MAAALPLSNIDDILSVIKLERNVYTVQELVLLRREQPGTFKDMTLRVGARSFKKFKPSDLQYIEKAYQNYSIIDVAGGAVAEAATLAYLMAVRLAQRHQDTGAHYQSISIFARSVGGTDTEISFRKLRNNDLPERPVVSIVSDVPYARRLEGIVHHGQRQGFLFHASKMVKKNIGKVVQVKFDFLAAGRLGKTGAPLPRIQIANPGDLKGASKNPRRRNV
jgi:hypothetical protein